MNKIPNELTRVPLPCPLCGGPAYYTETVNGTSMAYVGCTPCGISIKSALIPGPGPHQVQWSKDIIATWNNRAELDKTREELAAMTKDRDRWKAGLEGIE